MSAALWFPNAGGAFSQAQVQSAANADAEAQRQKQVRTAARRRSSGLQMQRTPPPALAPVQLQAQAQEQQNMSLPSKPSTPLPPLHPISQFNSPQQMQAATPQTPAVYSSALKAARARLSSGSSSKEASPADKENPAASSCMLSTPSTPKSGFVLNAVTDMSPLRFPVVSQETFSAAKIPSVQSTPLVTNSLSASPIAVSLAAAPARDVQVVPLASWTTPVRPAANAARRKSQGPSNDPRVEAMKERVATLLKSKQKQPHHAVTPAHRPIMPITSMTPAAADAVVDSLLAPLASVSLLTPYSQATEQAVAAALADRDQRAEASAWQSLLETPIATPIATPIPSPVATAAPAAIVEEETQPMDEDVHMDLAPVQEAEEEEVAAVEQTQQIPVKASSVPPSPADIVSMLISGKRSSPTAKAQITPISMATLSPATVVRRSYAHFSRELIADMTSPEAAASAENEEQEISVAETIAAAAETIPIVAEKSVAITDATPVAAPIKSSWSLVRIVSILAFIALIAAGAIFHSGMINFAPASIGVAPIAAPILSIPATVAPIEPVIDIAPISEIEVPIAATDTQLIVEEIIVPAQTIETAAIIESAVEAAEPEIEQVEQTVPETVATESAIAEEIIIAEPIVVADVTIEETPVEAVVPVEPIAESVVEVEAIEPTITNGGEVETKWSWSPSAVIAEEDMFAMPFAPEPSSAFGMHAPLHIIVHAPLQPVAPIATVVEAEIPAIAIAEPAIIAEQPAEIIERPAEEVAPSIEEAAPIDAIVPEPEAKPEAIIEQEEHIVEQTAAIIEIAVVAAPIDTIVVEQISEPEAIEIIVSAPVVLVEPTVAPIVPEAAFSWRGPIAIVAFVGACIIGGLLQSAESASAAAVTTQQAAPSPASIRAPHAAAAPATPAVAPASGASKTSPFSFDATPLKAAPTPAASAAVPVAAAKRVSLSPIKPQRKILFSPDSATRPSSATGLSPTTPAPFEGLSARLDSTSASLQAMRASIEQAVAAGGRLHVDMPMTLPTRNILRPAATNNTLTVPVAAPAPVLATTSKRGTRSRAQPTPASVAPERRSTRLSMRVQ